MHTPGWTEYVGVDVMPSVCKKVDFLGKYYQKRRKELGGVDDDDEKKVELWCEPSEKLAKNKAFLKRYRNYFDLVMICPPYFNMEIYHEGPQSIEMYPEYEDWLEKYWRATAKLCHHTCASGGGKFALIVNNYATLDGDYYPLVKDLSRIAREVGFKEKGFYYLYNRTSPLRMNAKDRTERLIIFEKV